MYIDEIPKKKEKLIFSGCKKSMKFIFQKKFEKKNNKTERPTWYFQTSYRVTLIKPMWCCHKERHKD